MAIELNLYLGIIWNNPSPDEVLNTSTGFLQSLEKSLDLSQIPVHWAIPSYPLLENHSNHLEELISKIKNRIGSSHDVLMAMGYGYNHHPSLSLNECEKELSWNLKNPWNSGLENIFGQKSEILLPGLVDLYRKDIIELYIKHGFNKIAIPIEHFNYFHHSLKQFETLFDFDYFTYHSIYPGMPIEVNRDLKKAIKKGARNLVLFLNQSPLINKHEDIASNQSIEFFFQKLNQKYRLQFKSLQVESYKETPQSLIFQQDSSKQIIYNQSLINRWAAQSIYKQRKDFLEEEKIHEVLKVLSPLGKKQIKNTAPKNIFPPASRFNDASMPGEARLAGSNFTVIFREGKICDLEIDQKTLLCNKLSRSYVIYNDAEMDLENISTFSVMDEDVHGLRDIQILNHGDWEQPMKMITDYFFVDEFPLLLVSSHMDYPAFNTPGNLQRIAPFELSLFEMEKNDEIIISAYSDSFDYRTSIKAEEGCFLLAGNYFQLSFRQNQLTIGYPPQIDPILGTMEFRVEQTEEAFLFKVNILGSYMPTHWSDWHKKSEEASFFIGLLQGNELHDFNQTILKELPQPKIWSTE